MEIDELFDDPNFTSNICVLLEEKDIIDMFMHMSKNDISLLLELILKSYLLFIHYEIIGFSVYAVKPFNKMEGTFELSTHNGFHSIDGEFAISILSIYESNIIINRENVVRMSMIDREREYICKKFIDVSYKNLEFTTNRLQFKYHSLIEGMMFYKYKKIGEEYCDTNVQIMENIIPIKIYRDIISIEHVNMYSSISLEIKTKNPVIISYTILYGYDKMVTIYCVTEKEFLLTNDIKGVLSISYNSINSLINKLNGTDIHNNTCVIIHDNIVYFAALVSALTKTCLRFLSFEVVAYVKDFVDIILIQKNIEKYNLLNFIV